MSFRINTNLQAMNALRNLTKSTMDASQSMTRLTTGLRINSGADDPAGLQISEGFRGQIAGIQQAIRNGQDATNFAKTAEGALAEVNKLLTDARSLALANSNDATLSTAQKQANQDQLNSILSSIDRIAGTTQFGNKKLLDGSAGVAASITDSTKVSALSIGGTLGTGLSASTQSVSSSGGVAIDVQTAALKATSAYAQGRALAATTVATALTTAVGSANAGDFTINGVKFTATANMTNQDVVNMVNARSSDTGVILSMVNNGGAATFQFSATKFGDIANTINITSASTAVAAAAGNFTLGNAGAGGQLGVDGYVRLSVNGGSYVDFRSASTDDGLTLRDSVGNMLRLTEAGNAVAVSTVGQVNAGSAQFQIGANIGQTASLSLTAASSSSLGLSALDIMSTSSAATALQNLDAAVDKVSKQRGDIGNFMRNVLDSNARSLSIAKENLSAADSTIRDVDVAEEMTRFTQLQILQQSGMSMLAQANSAPSAVLTLLRG